VGVDVYFHIVLTSALVGGEWSASCPCRFTPGGRAPSTHWIGGWVDPRASLDDVEKVKFLTLSGLELLPLRRPARNQSLYRLSYPGTYEKQVCRKKNTPLLVRCNPYFISTPLHNGTILKTLQCKVSATYGIWVWNFSLELKYTRV
jgi:hypothetical protein